MPFDPFKHNPDLNPEWTANVAWRMYRCYACGHEKRIQTNHTGKVWSERCGGSCRTITNPHTAREQVGPAYTFHEYVCEAE